MNQSAQLREQQDHDRQHPTEITTDGSADYVAAIDDEDIMMVNDRDNSTSILKRTRQLLTPPHHRHDNNGTDNESNCHDNSDPPNIFWEWVYWFSSIDGIVFLVFLCNIMVLSLPVILVPLAVEAQYFHDADSADRAYNNANNNDDNNNDNNNNDNDDSLVESTWVAAQVASISSLAFLGGAAGKFVNGFICQKMGAATCSKIYLFGMALSTAWFSLSRSNLALGMAFAGMEFFSSVQYAALSVILSNFYAHDEAQLASALTALGLASTIGDVSAKVIGVVLAACMPWRRVAQIGSLVAMVACLLVSQIPPCCNDGNTTTNNNNESPPSEGKCSDKDHSNLSPSSVTQYHNMNHNAPPEQASSYQSESNTQTSDGEVSVLRSLRNILRSTLFWKLATPYSLVFTAAACDRLLVPFYNEMAGLPQNVCGFFTLSITFGLVHGLVTGSKKYTTLQTLAAKIAFLRNRHIGLVVAALGLTLLSKYGPDLVSELPETLKTVILTAAVFFLSAAMASTISFQYFQLPSLISQKYPDNKAVCISFLDGMGFLFSIPIFTAMGWIVPLWGWEAGWGLLTILFVISGTALVRTIPPILDATELYELHHSPGDDPTDLDPCYYFEWAFDLYA